MNHPNTFKNNPCYQIALKSPLNGHVILVELRGPKQYNVGFDILCSNVVDAKAPGAFSKKSSGPFRYLTSFAKLTCVHQINQCCVFTSHRSGFVILELENVPSGVYNLIPSTFDPGCEGPFILKVQCTSEFTMKLV